MPTPMTHLCFALLLHFVKNSLEASLGVVFLLSYLFFILYFSATSCSTVLQFSYTLINYALKPIILYSLMNLMWGGGVFGRIV